MKKNQKILALLFAAFFVLAGCAERPAASYADGSPQSSEAEPSSQAAATKAPVSAAEEPPAEKEDPNALRICLDLGTILTQNDREIRVIETLLASGLRMAGGPENIVFDSIPYSGSEREIALDKIRTDIMAGGGPDVFIVTERYAGSLFPVPEKAMHEGLFLPLDSYIQSAAQSDWDKLMPAVMEAGQTDEGQVLVPMMYTLPVTIYHKEDVPEAPPAGTTWQEMLEDETNILRNAAVMGFNVVGGLAPSADGSIVSILGQFADYEAGTLLFSEEDLLQCTEALLTLRDEIDSDAALPEYAQGMLYGSAPLTMNQGRSEGYPLCRNDPMTMIPVYAKDGGVTATVEAYVGVNRNTKHAEEAFSVVDYLMRAETQQNLKIFYVTPALPVHEDVLSEEYPQQQFASYFIDENFEAFSNMRDQITNAVFSNTLVHSLDELYTGLYFSYNEQGEVPPEQAIEDAVHEAYRTLEQMLSE